MSYMKYESLAHAEAEDITKHLPTALGGLTSEQIVTIQELIADGYAKGLQAGFDMSDFADSRPQLADAMEIYNAGYAEGKKEK